MIYTKRRNKTVGTGPCCALGCVNAWSIFRILWRGSWSARNSRAAAGEWWCSRPLTVGWSAWPHRSESPASWQTRWGTAGKRRRAWWKRSPAWPRRHRPRSRSVPHWKATTRQDNNERFIAALCRGPGAPHLTALEAAVISAHTPAVKQAFSMLQPLYMEPSAVRMQAPTANLLYGQYDCFRASMAAKISTCSLASNRGGTYCGDCSLAKRLHNIWLSGVEVLLLT